MGRGRCWLGMHRLMQAVHVSASPNLVAQVQTTFAEWAMLKKAQRTTPGHCIEGTPCRACEHQVTAGSLSSTARSPDACDRRGGSRRCDP